MRRHLTNEVGDLINDFGPKLYGDFNGVCDSSLSQSDNTEFHASVQWRILVPSASAPPSTGIPGLWRRKSSTGAVDAQGLGLTHPMTWIDERLFGWSHSAKRGTSAWSGFSGEESRVATPDDSDDEDAGDYDNVIGFIPNPDEKLNSKTTHKSRSRNSSYADLQRLRLSPLAPLGTTTTAGSLAVPTGQLSASSSTSVSPSTELDGLHFHQGPRNRKASLNDGVSVRRLAQVDPEESFDQATDDLNDEIRHKKAKQG